MITVTKVKNFIKKWMPTKRKRDLKIDGFMAWLFAHTMAMRAREPEYDESRFDITHISLD